MDDLELKRLIKSIYKIKIGKKIGNCYVIQDGSLNSVNKLLRKIENIAVLNPNLKIKIDKIVNVIHNKLIIAYCNKIFNDNVIKSNNFDDEFIAFIISAKFSNNFKQSKNTSKVLRKNLNKIYGCCENELYKFEIYSIMNKAMRNDNLFYIKQFIWNFKHYVSKLFNSCRVSHGKHNF